MLALIGSFLVKLLGSGIVAPVMEYFKQKSSDGVVINGQNVAGDVSISQAQLTAYVEERKVIAQEKAALQNSRWTEWMIPSAFGFCMFHFGAIVLDSTCHFNWQVAKLPGIYAQMEWSIVASVIGINGIAPTVRKIFGK